MFKIGFVGLDKTGQRIVSHVMETKGHPVMGYDDQKENRELFHRNGGIAVEDPYIIYENCNLIILRLTDAHILTESIENILETNRQGLTIINISPITPREITEIKNKCLQLQTALLDVTIPEVGLTETFDLDTLLVRGEKIDYDKMTGFMNSIGKSLVYGGLIQDK